MTAPMRKMFRGDTGPSLTIDLSGVDANGNPTAPDLAAATKVKLVATLNTDPLFTRIITDGSEDGVLEFRWEAEDTAIVGIVRFEVEVTSQDGVITTYRVAESVQIVPDWG